MIFIFLLDMWDSKHKGASHQKKQKWRARIHEVFQRYVR